MSTWYGTFDADEMYVLCSPYKICTPWILLYGGFKSIVYMAVNAKTRSAYTVWFIQEHQIYIHVQKKDTNLINMEFLTKLKAEIIWLRNP